LSKHAPVGLLKLPLYPFPAQVVMICACNKKGNNSTKLITYLYMLLNFSIESKVGKNQVVEYNHEEEQR
jgi:hypothetical protein